MTSLITLVPAYKTAFLPDLLQCFQRQTFRDFKIVISDDSPGDQVTSALRSAQFSPLLAGLNVSIVQGPKRGGARNLRHLSAQFGQEAEFVHFMMDDDLIYPDFYSVHMQRHAAVRLMCTVSRRWTCDSTGLPLRTLSEPAAVKALVNRWAVFDRPYLFDSVVPTCNNWLGEFSNIVVRRELAHFVQHFEVEGVSLLGLGDLGLVLAASLHGTVAWISESLGAFRLNVQQNTGNIGSPAIKAGHLAWLAVACAALKGQHISSQQAVQCVARLRQVLFAVYPHDQSMLDFVPMFGSEAATTTFLLNDFPERWAAFLSSHNDVLGLDL